MTCAVERFLFLADIGFGVRLSREQAQALAGEIRGLRGADCRCGHGEACHRWRGAPPDPHPGFTACSECECEAYDPEPDAGGIGEQGFEP